MRLLTFASMSERRRIVATLESKSTQALKDLLEEQTEIYPESELIPILKSLLKDREDDLRTP